MSKSSPQNLKNHGRIDPPVHIVLFLVLVANLIFAVVHMLHHREDAYFAGPWYVVLSLALFLLLLRVRSYPLKVQDRIIRLEERLRLKALAPAAWHSQIHRLSEDQLIGLRFAPDEEVVPLAQQALAENLNRKQIKERIQNWRADHFRV